MKITVNKQIEVEIDTLDLALAFTDWSSDDQAMFFNKVSKTFDKWGSEASDRQKSEIARVMGEDAENFIESLNSWTEYYRNNT